MSDPSRRNAASMAERFRIVLIDCHHTYSTICVKSLSVSAERAAEKRSSRQAHSSSVGGRLFTPIKSQLPGLYRSNSMQLIRLVHKYNIVVLMRPAAAEALMRIEAAEGPRRDELQHRAVIDDNASYRSSYSLRRRSVDKCNFGSSIRRDLSSGSKR